MVQLIGVNVCEDTNTGGVNLAIDYRFSSANFYENGINEFGILTHIEAWYN
jgi:hypothetical protein